MTVLSNRLILKLNNKYKIIENLSEREKQNPEGVGFDLRVGSVYKLEGVGYLGVKSRKTPNVTKIADINDGHKSLLINPGDYYLIQTIESVNLPSNKVYIEEIGKDVYITAFIFPRTTLFRSGILLLASKVDPGYSGKLTFALTNISKSPFELELGSRIANIVFLATVGEIYRPYEGSWKGGKVSTYGVEEQK